ncbi:hypothetical protein Pmani_038250 [Petrolisthes manimaculis]|uniref:Uncharacterized protein n=1 Tax=Petrolisthes manimaculis TaxID=1843537 RepID=A0AAE1TMH3_9EUCA|nr:hypothetical protein Pmani_038250 [Petrolisthes manimaculis]
MLLRRTEGQRTGKDSTEVKVEPCLGEMKKVERELSVETLSSGQNSQEEGGKLSVGCERVGETTGRRRKGTGKRDGTETSNKKPEEKKC